MVNNGISIFVCLWRMRCGRSQAIRKKYEKMRLFVKKRKESKQRKVKKYIRAKNIYKKVVGICEFCERRTARGFLSDWCALCGVFVRLVCRSCVLCDSRGIVRGASCFRRVAFPLGMRSRLKFPLVLRFCVSVGVLVWVCGFRAVLGGF